MSDISEKGPYKAFTQQERLDLALLLQEIIEIPSPSSQEGDLANRIRQKCAEIGFDQVITDRAGSIIAIKRNGEGPTLLFDTHMDTARPLIADHLGSNSYDSHFDGKRIQGLGACEGKSSIAAILFALERFIADVPFQGTLVAVFLVLGNFCEGDSLKLVLEEMAITPDWIILGEPSNLNVIRGHRGRTHFNVRVKGKSCHSATPHLGKNAIMAASRLLFDIDLLSADLLQDEFLGAGTIAVTAIASEAPAINSLPHTCTLSIDRRLTVGETATRARSELENAIARENIQAEIETAHFNAFSYTGFAFSREGDFNAWTLDEQHPLPSAALAIIREIAPEKAVSISSTFSTDGAYSMGERGIPTIGFGPGDAALTHTGDESVSADDLLIAARVFYRLAIRFLT